MPTGREQTPVDTGDAAGGTGSAGGGRDGYRDWADGRCYRCGLTLSGPICPDCSQTEIPRQSKSTAEFLQASPASPTEAGANLLDQLKTRGMPTETVVDGSGNTHLREPRPDHLPDGVSGVTYEVKEVTLPNGDRATVVDPTKPFRMKRK